MKLESKKGQLGGVLTGVLIIVAIVVAVAVSLVILQNVGDSTTDNSLAQNTTETLSQDIADNSGLIGVLFLVLIAGAIIAFLLRSFVGGAGRA